MTTDLPSLTPGTRVVLRYRLPAGSTHPMTDVIGTLEATGPLIRVRAADGHEVEVTSDRVVALKALGPRPVRTKDIRTAELALALASAPEHDAWVGGWWVRAGAEAGSAREPGSVLDSGSALPLADSPMRGAGALADLLADATLERVSRWYADRGLPALLQIPDRLARVPDGWRAHDEQLVLTVALSTPRSDVGDTVMQEVPGSARPVAATLRDDDGAVLAQAWASVPTIADEVPRMVLQRVEVTATARRAGHGRRICTDLMSWGERQGARMCIARVAQADPDTLAFLHALGFTDHHRTRLASPADPA
ncbi:GNAT family N-acetyltransferase [Rhodococcus sp. D2-41]|uniref:GNAT family N-acetyltransferase n=1 Tax=Speluncibacter jeojiensis TaxID=2710754 RepID=A0A9X4M3Q2_9ACTN|nr:GNAT family N-acetyltransferase [Rhodococcus sp. D2-41]MDG3010037.1 GNAT family N-acetyltransferase [Rhodococcus sp. D2-41]MDG3016259.1 GNAT family N-acetyltransferase [Corynebacteriales bacterium D3-21]